MKLCFKAYTLAFFSHDIQEEFIKVLAFYAEIKINKQNSILKAKGKGSCLTKAALRDDEFKNI